MANLVNQFVGYVDRTYDQIVTNVLQKFGANVPEITDHTQTNPWVKGISIWSGMIEMLGYYLDGNAREVFLSTALEFASGVKTARLFNYRVKGAAPASVTLRFTSSIPATANINIASGTKVQAPTGEYFATITAGVILMGHTFIDVQAKQWKSITGVDLGISDSSANQDFSLESDIADGSVTIQVNATQYNSQDTFAYSFPTSTDFVAGLDTDGNMHVVFGDGINALIPPGGQDITAAYQITLGSGGNISANKITQIVSVIAVPGAEVLSVTNLQASSGGADAEDLADLAKLIPLSIRTRYRAVTKQDFIDVTELFLGVQRAGVNYNCDIDKYVHVYIIPAGGGPASPALISDVEAYLETRKIITSLLDVESAGIVYFKITATINMIPGYSNAQGLSDAQDAVIALFDPANQTISGHVAKGDIYQALEDVRGVDYTEITLLLPVPFGRPTANTHVLNWTPVMQPGSAATQDWTIKFITNTNYEVYKGTDFQGSFNTDVAIVFAEINFTVNGAHTAGDTFVFYTYAYNQSTFLAEPSIPATQLGFLNFNVIGGS